MRRNRDLIRQLLMEIEDCDTGDGESVELDFGEADTLVARGHLNLFVEEGLIEADEAPDKVDNELMHYLADQAHVDHPKRASVSQELFGILNNLGGVLGRADDLPAATCC